MQDTSRRAFSVIMSSVCAEAEVEGGPAAILLAKLACCGKGAGPLCILRVASPGLPAFVNPARRVIAPFAAALDGCSAPLFVISEYASHSPEGRLLVKDSTNIMHGERSSDTETAHKLSLPLRLSACCQPRWSDRETLPDLRVPRRQVDQPASVSLEGKRRGFLLLAGGHTTRDIARSSLILH